MSRKVGGREATTGIIPGRYCLSVGKPDIEPPEGWAWRSLSELARLESGHTPSRRKPEYWGGDVSWIGIKDATGNHGRVLRETMQHTNELGIANSAARILPANTVCLSRTASVGYVVVMGSPMATSQDFANWVCGPDLDFNFLKYALLLENEALHRFSYGSTHRTIYYPELKAFHICAPQVDEQREIAAVLGALDDKIELNRKTAATLEAMARALYRSWFVDFDPVTAKAEGRAPTHMDEDTAGLFPDRFGDDGLPVGWEDGTVGDLLILQRGFDLPKKDRTDGDFPVLAAGGHHGTHNEFKARGPGVTTGRSGVIGEVFLVLDDFWPLNTSLWVKDFIRCSPYFAYFFLQMLDLKALNSGSAVPSLNRNNVHNLRVDLPPERLIEAFDEVAGPMFARVHQVTTENQTLATLRDTLLPRLMSGELRVGEARDEVEAVA
ncbi:MAG: restriction endonuclease subunit S [Oceanospirillaceae bacterium]|uniref:restriction endonuclease subunit S n=1 Tax=Salipiger sp. HF18 TaxID=2721557 RepID=UPI00142E493B|nr:restriction endonuclease subunit S [Salipiger sp. HF18]NIY95456.1 hypothetical protein [Salipiger sp. HF18]NVK43481.1 restriction endonuclease subunit S [Oceanospirillaceae bacterium]